MNVDDYDGREGLLALDELCRRMAAAGQLDELVALLQVKASRTYEKHDVPRIVAAALASAGPIGISKLVESISSAPGHIYPLAIIRCIWSVATDSQVLQSTLGITYPAHTIPAGTLELAASVIDDLVIEAQTDPNLYQLLLALQHEDFMRPAGTEDNSPKFSPHMMHVVRESSIILTHRLIGSLATLVGQAGPEAAYQSFLERHPVFIDPLAAEVYNRARLGLELITDFVVRRHDGRYVVVEIEKPQDPIFTRSGDFSHQFNHAVRQVLDFQGWIASNIAYAQRAFPLIENPSGLVVIGTRDQLDPELQDRLRRWMTNSRHLEVMTFDDLIVRARALLASLRYTPAQSLQAQAANRPT